MKDVSSRTGLAGRAAQALLVLVVVGASSTAAALDRCDGSDIPPEISNAEIARYLSHAASSEGASDHSEFPRNPDPYRNGPWIYKWMKPEIRVRMVDGWHQVYEPEHQGAEAVFRDLARTVESYDIGRRFRRVYEGQYDAEIILKGFGRRPKNLPKELIDKPIIGASSLRLVGNGITQS